MMFVVSVLALLFVAFITQPTPCESLKCYECSGNTSCGQSPIDRIVDCAGKCLSYLNEDDHGTTIQRCCSDNCKMEDSYKVYSCSDDECNGIHFDWKLLAIRNKIAQKRVILKRAAEEQGTSLSCYDCSAHNPNCGVSEATIVQGCRACLVYHNIFDNNNVIRACCNSNCGASDTIGDYNGRTAYFCSSDRCNGIGAENVLTGETELTSATTLFPTLSSTRTTTTVSTTTKTTTVQTSFSCYDCSGANEQQCTSTISNCPMCMVHRNDNDPTKFDQRCCWWGCGSPDQVTSFNGRPTYFCNADKCNGPGSEAILGYITTTTGTTVVRSTTLTTTSTTQQTASQCYECSGSDCGKEGSTLATNCPSCMVYRNSNDQTKIERRCCWWGCGPSNSVGTYNGLETYFCTGDKCNGYGVESALRPPVTTTTTTSRTMTTSVTITSQMTTKTTTSSVSTCVLNCQNGGTAETEDGCFCYCLENTNGRECENVDCAQPDVDSEICSLENQSLCEESETFAFECLHLCGKC